MAFLDPELTVLLANKAYFEEHPSAGSVPLKPDSVIYISLHFNGDINDIDSSLFTAGTIVGDRAFGATTLAGLQTLASHPQIESISRQRKPKLGLNKSIPDIKANAVWKRQGDRFSGYNGKNVIVGIIDTGIDFQHHCFRKPDGKTRILKIWDQTLEIEGAEKRPDPITHVPISPSPHPLNYGVEYTEAQINDTLTSSSPAVRVRHKDDDGHGTHVAGIAAGDGSQAGGCHFGYHYIGVATEADLIVVRKWGLSKGDKDNPGTGSYQLDAIMYILSEAQKLGKPAVINLSFGVFTDEMDGTSDVCKAVDKLLLDNSVGKAIVWGAGNNADERFHAAGTILPGETLELKFRVYKDDKEQRTIAIRYPGGVDVQVTSPIGGVKGTVPFVAPGANGISLTANGGGVDSGVGVTNAVAGFKRIAITIVPPTDSTVTPPKVTAPNVAGTWKIELRNSGALATTFDAFCLDGSPHDRKSPNFLNHDTAQSTLCSQATGLESIAVGSYKVGGRLAESSSRGPTLDGRAEKKPEICAPGVDITSAGIRKDRREFEDWVSCRVCCCDCCQDFYVGKSGTSMAAPHITGVVALMLHRNPNLTHREIRDLLVAHPTPKPTNSMPIEDLGWGAGKVNAKDVLANVTEVNPPITVPFAAIQPEDALASLHDRLLATDRGGELAELVPKHSEEIWSLINRNKKVATVWHRCKGPVWTRLAIKAAFSPKDALPQELEGYYLKDAIEEFARIVMRFASEQLKNDIIVYQPYLGLLRSGINLETLLDAVGSYRRLEAVNE